MQMINLPLTYEDRETSKLVTMERFYPASRILEVIKLQSGRQFEKGQATKVVLEGPNPSPHGPAGQDPSDQTYRVWTHRTVGDIVAELRAGSDDGNA